MALYWSLEINIFRLSFFTLSFCPDCPDCPDCPASSSLSWCPACLLVNLSPAHPHMSHIHLRSLSQLSCHTQAWVHILLKFYVHCTLCCVQYFFVPNVQKSVIRAYSRYKILYNFCSLHFECCDCKVFRDWLRMKTFQSKYRRFIFRLGLCADETVAWMLF